ncbi:MAG: CAP domain-containing protein [Chitinophagaceae bacterium]
MRRILFVTIIISLTLFSCKKSDVADNNSNSGSNNNNNNNSSSGDVVYNVNKATLLQLVNDVRTKGCTCGTTVMPPVGTVVWNDQLGKAAYDHSVDMYTNNYFSHTGQNGSDPGQRITAAGYMWTAYGENIASGYTNEQAVMNGWLGSEGHCKNIMGANYKDMGVGRDGNLWTQEFGSK